VLGWHLSINHMRTLCSQRKFFLVVMLCNESY
jgi:hypothetical protein